MRVGVIEAIKGKGGSKMIRLLRARTFGNNSSLIVAGFFQLGSLVLDLEDTPFRFVRGKVFLRCDLDGGLIIWMYRRVSWAPSSRHTCRRALTFAIVRHDHCCGRCRGLLTVALDGLKVD